MSGGNLARPHVRALLHLDAQRTRETDHRKRERKRESPVRPLREGKRRVNPARSNIARLTCGEKARRNCSAHRAKHLLHRIERRRAVG